jgi:hypothetical protein
MVLLFFTNPASEPSPPPDWRQSMSLFPVVDWLEYKLALPNATVISHSLLNLSVKNGAFQQVLSCQIILDLISDF